MHFIIASLALTTSTCCKDPASDLLKLLYLGFLALTVLFNHLHIFAQTLTCSCFFLNTDFPDPSLFDNQVSFYPDSAKVLLLSGTILELLPHRLDSMPLKVVIKLQFTSGKGLTLLS